MPLQGAIRRFIPAPGYFGLTERTGKGRLTSLKNNRGRQGHFSMALPALLLNFGEQQMTEETKKLKIPSVVYIVAAFAVLIAIGIATS